MDRGPALAGRAQDAVEGRERVGADQAGNGVFDLAAATGGGDLLCLGEVGGDGRGGTAFDDDVERKIVRLHDVAAGHGDLGGLLEALEEIGLLGDDFAQRAEILSQ